MNILINKIISAFHFGNSPTDEQSNKTYDSLLDRFNRWRSKPIPQVCIHLFALAGHDTQGSRKVLFIQSSVYLSDMINDCYLCQKKNLLFIFKGRLLFNDNHNPIKKNEIMCVTDIPFIIPRQIEDVRKQFRPNFERVKLLILRMDEYIISTEDRNQVIRCRQQDTSLGLRALVEAVNKVQGFAFREVLSIDETLPIVGINLIEEDDDDDDDSSMDTLFRRTEKIDPITNFQEAQAFVTFDEALTKHRTDILHKSTHRPSDMIYLKFCLMLEIQRDEYESCLRIILHDIIFKFHLSDFRLRCEIHVRKPIEHQLVLSKIVHDSHLKTNYSTEFVLWSGDWIVQQEVELYIVMKIESLSINKYMSSKFWDMAHLHVKNIPHGASRVFLRELTPVSRPHKIVSQHRSKF
jgi:hypothetical protein